MDTGALFDALSSSSLDGWIRAAGLHVVRILATISMLPMFGPSPAKVQKLGLALLVASVVISTRGAESLVDPGSDPLLLSILVLKESIFGLILGWLAGLVFDTVRVAGALLATEMGLNMANQIDPVTHSSQPLLSHLFHAMALVIFFTGGGAGTILRALVRSFDGVPIGSFAPTPTLVDSVLSFTGTMLEASLRFAGPVFVLLVVLTIVIGFLAKVAPSLNILEASYPIRILGALLLLAIFLPSMIHAFEGTVDTMSVELLAFAEGRH